MEAVRSGTHPGDSRFDGLRAEATAAVSYSANTVRSVRERYREAFAEALAHWQTLRDELDLIERRRPRRTEPDATSPAQRAMQAAEAGATDAHERTLRATLDPLTDELGELKAELGKLDLVTQTLERTWLFLERGDATLVTDASGPATSSDVAMRIVEAQEAERSRLAQDIHDGPAQALSNAIFQVDYIERVLASDGPLAVTELRLMREMLRRELGDLRSTISQLRPPLVDELGLEGAIDDVVEGMRAIVGIPITTAFEAPSDTLSDGARTVVLRITQEALQNVRKHASATSASVTTRIDDGDWTLEVVDDGRGFDGASIAARGRRNFGLQFMRERAELIGARFDIRSRPDGGTVVRLAIPAAAGHGG